MIIIVHVQCPAVYRGRRGWDQSQSISSPYNKSFSATTSLSNTFTHLLHQCHLLTPQPFPTAMPSYPPCTLPYFSRHYNFVHLISQYPLIPCKFLTSSINAQHFSCTTLTHYTPLIYNHFTSFLILQQPS